MVLKDLPVGCSLDISLCGGRASDGAANRQGRSKAVDMYAHKHEQKMQQLSTIVHIHSSLPTRCWEADPTMEGHSLHCQRNKQSYHFLQRDLTLSMNNYSKLKSKLKLESPSNKVFRQGGMDCQNLCNWSRTLQCFDGYKGGSKSFHTRCWECCPWWVQWLEGWRNINKIGEIWHRF